VSDSRDGHFTPEQFRRLFNETGYAQIAGLVFLDMRCTCMHTGQANSDGSSI
jgi:hypothetical protein